MKLFQGVISSSDVADRHPSSSAPEGSHWGLSVRMCGETTIASGHLHHEYWRLSVWVRQLFANKQNKKPLRSPWGIRSCCVRVTLMGSGLSSRTKEVSLFANPTFFIP